MQIQFQIFSFNQPMRLAIYIYSESEKSLSHVWLFVTPWTVKKVYLFAAS